LSANVPNFEDNSLEAEEEDDIILAQTMAQNTQNSLEDILKKPGGLDVIEQTD